MALAGTLALHLLLLMGIFLPPSPEALKRLPSPGEPPRPASLSVRWVPAISAANESIRPVEPTTGADRSANRPRPDKNAAWSAIVEPAPRSVMVYALDGSILVPADSKLRAAPPTALERAQELLHRGHNIVHCRHSRFASDYKPYETVGETVARNLALIGLYNPAVKEAVEQRQVRIRNACDE